MSALASFALWCTIAPLFDGRPECEEGHRSSTNDAPPQKATLSGLARKPTRWSGDAYLPRPPALPRRNHAVLWDARRAAVPIGPLRSGPSHRSGPAETASGSPMPVGFALPVGFA